MSTKAVSPVSIFGASATAAAAVAAGAESSAKAMGAMIAINMRHNPIIVQNLFIVEHPFFELLLPIKQNASEKIYRTSSSSGDRKSLRIYNTKAALPD
jgi:hypothetical protein